MANFSFNPIIAEQYGVDEAVFIQNVYFWIEKNQSENIEFFDGEQWLYCSVADFSKKLPFWTTRQIERMIKKLENEGALKIGKFNKNSYDRTRWFSLPEKIKMIYKNSVIE